VKLAGRIPVEPLDEERLTNIERRVVAGAVDAAIRGHELRAPQRLFGRAAFALAIAAAVVVGWALHGAAPSPPIVAEPAQVDVQTSAQRSVIDIGDARIESDPDTAFAVTRPAGGVVIAMARGRIELAVDKRGERPPLVVRAGDTEVVVVGTRFSVDCGDGRGEVAVRVTEGAVRVVRRDEQTRVAAGQSWRSHTGLVAMADAAGSTPSPGSASAASANAVTGSQNAGATSAAPASAATTTSAPAASATTASSPATAATTPSSPIAVPLVAAAPGVLHERTAAVPKTSRSAVAAPSAAPAATSADSSPTRVATAPRPSSPRPPVAVRADPHVDLRGAIRAQRVEPALDLGEPDPATAVARYYAIAAHRSGDEASQAFYSIAAVRSLRMGRNADALQTLDAYVSRFPGGKEYRAALWLRVRILCLERFDDRCRAAAYTYLHAAPDAPAARVAELVTQTE
jgi:FecR protein